MISISYQLRYEDIPVKMSPQSRRLRNSVLFLGRLRSAYEIFKRTALEFPEFKSLTIHCLPPPTGEWLTRSEISRRVQELAKDERIQQLNKCQLDSAWGAAARILTPCHAEVQLLLHFECSVPSDAKPFPYIGCSRKSCWLCYQPLTNYKDKRNKTKGVYQTRGSHRKIYPLWCVKLGSSSLPSPRVQFNLSVALLVIQMMMQQLLRNAPHTQRPKEAESSANLTITGRALSRRALARMRVAESSTRPEDTKSEVNTLEDFICSKKCVRFPATGESPYHELINFYNCPTDYPGPESVKFCVPDFSKYWGKFNLGRAFHIFTVKQQESTELNGDYLFYWCRSDELTPNKYLMSLVGIEFVPLEEHFWYGDVFITRFHEHGFKFHCEDVPYTFHKIESLVKSMIVKDGTAKLPKTRSEICSIPLLDKKNKH